MGPTQHLKMLLASLFLAFTVVLSACSLQTGSDNNPKITVPWLDGEVATMAVSHQGQEVGVSVLSADLIDDTWRLQTETIVETTVEEQLEQVTEKTIVLAEKDTLLPQHVELQAQVGADQLSFQGEYGIEKVDVELTSSEGDRTYSVDLPKRSHFDNEQFMFVLRALPLTNEWRGRVDLVVSRSASQSILGVWVIGEETVNTQIGDISTWLVEVRGLDQYAWIEKEAPHRLVKYENRAEEVVSLLTDYEPGQEQTESADND